MHHKAGEQGQYRTQSSVSGSSFGPKRMMFSDDSSLDQLLYGGCHGSDEGGAEMQSTSSDVSGDENSSLSVSLQSSPLVCAGCGRRVFDRFVLLAAGQAWHGGCLRCSECQCELQAQTSLYCKGGSIYCKQDYGRIFGAGKCSRCSQPIPSSSMVMRSGDMTFHPHCFSCQECDIILLPGNLYCVEGRNIYCRSHYHSDGGTPAASSLQPSNSPGEEPVSSPEPRWEETARELGTGRRVKRIRTCFRSEQLRALEAYFAQKHNPDGKDWTCLSNHTGLPKRVLQVWFQNARAKLRRMSLSSETPTLSPTPGAATMTTVTMAPCQDAQSLASTIDRAELSMLSLPLYEDSAFLNYNPHHAHELSSLANI